MDNQKKNQTKGLFFWSDKLNFKVQSSKSKPFFKWNYLNNWSVFLSPTTGHNLFFVGPNTTTDHSLPEQMILFLNCFGKCHLLTLSINQYSAHRYSAQWQLLNVTKYHNSMHRARGFSKISLFFFPDADAL